MILFLTSVIILTAIFALVMLKFLRPLVSGRRAYIMAVASLLYFCAIFYLAGRFLGSMK